MSSAKSFYTFASDINSHAKQRKKHSIPQLARYALVLAYAEPSKACVGYIDGNLSTWSVFTSSINFDDNFEPNKKIFAFPKLINPLKLVEVALAFTYLLLDRTLQIGADTQQKVQKPKYEWSKVIEGGRIVGRNVLGGIYLGVTSLFLIPNTLFETPHYLANKFGSWVNKKLNQKPEQKLLVSQAAQLVVPQAEQPAPRGEQPALEGGQPTHMPVQKISSFRMFMPPEGSPYTSYLNKDGTPIPFNPSILSNVKNEYEEALDGIQQSKSWDAVDTVFGEGYEEEKTALPSCQSY